MKLYTITPQDIKALGPFPYGDILVDKDVKVRIFMPYLMPETKKYLRDELNLKSVQPQTAGELNFLFCEIARSYLASKGESYQNYNDIIGALEGAKLELYRRKVAPYEQKKLLENGDVF